MSAHVMILGLILEFDLPINVNHVSTAQTCKPSRGDRDWRKEGRDYKVLADL